MNESAVLIARTRAVGTITLNRPDKRNALDDASIAGLLAGITELDGDAAIRVVVLRGAGADFCAGADLAQLQRIGSGADAMENLRDAQQLGDLFIHMRQASKPIVAAVHGNAIAGGAGLATACDIVLASEDARFGYPEVHLGFVPAMVMALLHRAVGEKIAFELVTRGDRISAHEAHRIGLVNQVFDADSFDEDVHRYAAELSIRSASAVSLTKRLLYGIDGASFNEAIARGVEVNALARATTDCQEGVQRFLARKRD